MISRILSGEIFLSDWSAVGVFSMRLLKAAGEDGDGDGGFISLTEMS